MPKIQRIIFEEQETKEIIHKLLELGNTCKNIKKYYPSVWGSIVEQFQLDYTRDKIISDGLFSNKLELLLLQDDELRKK